MAQVLVRNLDDDVKTRLQQRARRHGRSIAARFAGKGLDSTLPELRGQSARPAAMEP